MSEPGSGTPGGICAVHHRGGCGGRGCDGCCDCTDGARCRSADEEPARKLEQLADAGDHVLGTNTCPGCWGEPQPCEDPTCPGFVHSEYVDESYDAESGEEYLHIASECDVCGESA